MILFRYIFSQLASTVLATVGLFTFILLAGNVLRDILKLWTAGRLDFQLLLELLGLLIPYVVAYALPLGVLSAVLIVFGRLSANREIVAMQAAGISLVKICKPLILLALVSVALSLSINLHFGPKARGQFKERLANAFVADPSKFIAKGRFMHEFPGYIVFAKSQDGAMLQNICIWELDENQAIRKILNAKEAYIQEDIAHEILTLQLYQGYSQAIPIKGQPNATATNRHLNFNEATLSLPIQEFFRPNFFQKKRAQMTLIELLQERKNWISQEKTNPTAFQERISVQLQLQKNFAMGFAIIALLLIALPLGIRVSRTETYANCSLALGLAMLYYLSVVVASGLENFPHLRPDLCIWIPNIIFGGIGVRLILRKG